MRQHKRMDSPQLKLPIKHIEYLAVFWFWHLYRMRLLLRRFHLPLNLLVITKSQSFSDKSINIHSKSAVFFLFHERISNRYSNIGVFVSNTSNTQHYRICFRLS